MSLIPGTRIDLSGGSQRRAVASRYRNAQAGNQPCTHGTILLFRTDEVIKIRVHYDPDLRPEDVTTVDGIPVTTPARLTTYAELKEVMARYPR
jgi:hypothetical protein